MYLNYYLKYMYFKIVPITGCQLVCRRVEPAECEPRPAPRRGKLTPDSALSTEQ